MIACLPTPRIPVTDANNAEPVVALLKALEDNDDVQNVYSSEDIPEKILAG